MELTFISDTHTKQKIFTDDLKKGGDVIVCCGDVTRMGEEQDLRKFVNWYDQLPFKYKIMIAGNHDFIFEQTPLLARRILKSTSIIYLENDEIVVNGIKFYGSPVIPYFSNWAFSRQRGTEIKKNWEQIPPDTNVLITHGPPYGILDTLGKDYHVGCKSLREAVLQIKPAIHAFGHIHESYGRVSKGGVSYINASLLNENYQPVHKPITVAL